MGIRGIDPVELEHGLGVEPEDPGHHAGTDRRQAGSPPRGDRVGESRVERVDTPADLDRRADRARGRWLIAALRPTEGRSRPSLCGRPISPPRPPGRSRPSLCCPPISPPRPPGSRSRPSLCCPPISPPRPAGSRSRRRERVVATTAERRAALGWPREPSCPRASPARHHARLVALVLRCGLALPSGSFRSGGPVRVRTPGLCLFLLLFLILSLSLPGPNSAIFRVFSCPVSSGLACRASDPARARSGLPRGAWDPAGVRVSGWGTRRALRRDRRVGTRGSGVPSVRASSVRIGARHVGSGASSVRTDARPVEFRASSADDQSLGRCQIGY